MRFTTVVSLLFASCALLSGSPAVYAAPVPSPVDSIRVKRICEGSACRDVVVPTPESPSTDTATTSPSTDVQNLVQVLINALQTYQNAETTSNTTTTVDLATPEEAGDGSEPVPVIDALIDDDSSL